MTDLAEWFADRWVPHCICCGKRLYVNTGNSWDATRKEYVERIERICYLQYGCPNKYEEMPKRKNWEWHDDMDVREIFPIGNDGQEEKDVQ